MRRAAGRALLGARWAAAVAVAGRLAPGARRPPPLAPRPGPVPGGVSVVVPARDEEARIGPLLDAVVGDPDVDEVLVVDDESSDATADVARAAGAHVVPGGARPPGWAGKTWALHQGLEAATRRWVVCLDADTRPHPGLVGAVVAAAEEGDLDLLTVAPRFDCRTPGERLVHPAMLATLVYRFGAPGRRRRRPGRVLANGQCMVAERPRLLALGGLAPVRGSLVEDVALARHLARRGRRVGFLDGRRLLDVRMHDGGGDVWRAWGRSLPLPGLAPPWRQALDVGVVWLAAALPLPRLLLRRGDGLDVALLAVRLGLLAALAPSYRRRGAPYLLSPLADVAVAVRLTRAWLRPERTWRGRTYPRPRRAPRWRSAGRSGT